MHSDVSVGRPSVEPFSYPSGVLTVTQSLYSPTCVTLKAVEAQSPVLPHIVPCVEFHSWFHILRAVVFYLVCLSHHL